MYSNRTVVFLGSVSVIQLGFGVKGSRFRVKA